MTGHASPAPDGQITHLLGEVVAGAPGAESRLWEVVFPTCLGIARQQLQADRLRRHLHPRDLVDLAFLKLTGGRLPHLADRRAFFALTASAMRQAMTDTARELFGRNGTRADTAAAQKPPADLAGDEEWTLADLLAVEQALVALAREEPQQARVVELKFFSRLSIDEIAAVMGICRRATQDLLAKALVRLAALLGKFD